MRVLLAEDDTDVLDLTTYALRKYGYDVVGVTDGATALKRWETEQPDLVLLDVNLPILSGMDVCQKIRERSSTPVIMVSAMDDEDHIVEGFERGADDYMCKPVSYRQLAMRMRAVGQRRDSGEPVLHSSATAAAANISVDLHYWEVCHADTPIGMTRLEIRILYLLVRNAGRVIPTERLIDFAWNYQSGDAFALKTHISQIRRKLGMSKGEPGYISCMPRVGYKLQTR